LAIGERMEKEKAEEAKQRTKEEKEKWEKEQKPYKSLSLWVSSAPMTRLVSNSLMS